jgi:plasmid stability protein
MRTTISLDDRLALQVRRRAASEGKSVSAFIAGILADALTKREAPESPPFRLVTVGGNGPRPGIDLDRPRALFAEDDEVEWSPGRRT